MTDRKTDFTERRVQIDGINMTRKFHDKFRVQRLSRYGFT